MARMIDIYRERLAREGVWGLAASQQMAIDAIGEGAATVSMEAHAGLSNPAGTLHGGVYCDLADMAMGIAFFSQLGDSEAMTTLELKINYLRPILGGRIRAVARVVNRGRSTGLVECDVLDAQGRLAARASCTCYVLTGEKAEATLQSLRGGG